jgi:hypothetical protein
MGVEEVTTVYVHLAKAQDALRGSVVNLTGEQLAKSYGILVGAKSATYNAETGNVEVEYVPAVPSDTLNGPTLVALCDIRPEGTGKKGKRHTGQIYQELFTSSGSPNYYLLSQVDTNCVALIHLGGDANRWSKPIQVNHPQKITAEEWKAITAYQGKSFRRVKSKKHR